MTDEYGEIKCTCPCLACIEGNHCGQDREFNDGNGLILTSVCHYLPSELFFDDENTEPFPDEWPYPEFILEIDDLEWSG